MLMESRSVTVVPHAASSLDEPVVAKTTECDECDVRRVQSWPHCHSSCFLVVGQRSLVWD